MDEKNKLHTYSRGAKKQQKLKLNKAEGNH